MPQAEQLFYQASLMSIPLAPALLLSRKTLFFDPNGRRATFSIVGGFAGMCLHRWFAMQYDHNPSEIITIDMIIVGMALLNSAPAIRSGPWLALLCVVNGAINFAFPWTYWPGSMMVTLILSVVIARDWLREWKTPQKDTKKEHT